jgi:hypothetical protein
MSTAIAATNVQGSCRPVVIPLGWALDTSPTSSVGPTVLAGTRPSSAEQLRKSTFLKFGSHSAPASSRLRRWCTERSAAQNGFAPRLVAHHRSVRRFKIKVREFGKHVVKPLDWDEYLTQSAEVVRHEGACNLLGAVVVDQEINDVRVAFVKEITRCIGTNTEPPQRDDESDCGFGFRRRGARAEPEAERSPERLNLLQERSNSLP